MLPPLDIQTGSLPKGRFPATLEHIEERFVRSDEYRGSGTRDEIWDGFKQLIERIETATTISWIWVGGSFLTSKPDPDDIDVVIWCKQEDIDAVTGESDRFLLWAVAENQIRLRTGLRVDTRICHWHIEPEPGLQENDAHRRYAMERGFWDDFWLRARTGAKGEPLQYEDAFPKRGYLEVWLGGEA